MSKTNIIFLEPYLDNKIWGGTRLKEFNFKLESNNVGEALIVSAIDNKSSKIINSNIDEKNLLEFYNNHPDFFSNYKGTYPILTKIIDANEDLSIQVHPDDAYSLYKHNKLGKNECWYILDAKPDSKIIYGLNCQSIDELKQSISDNTIEEKLNYITVKKGDTIYVPAGTVHAITSGLLIYELQQNSDITYRLYDYNRLENGKLRELMVDDALNVIKLNQEHYVTHDNYLIDCEYFKLIKIDVCNDTLNLKIDDALWLEVTVIDGNGKVDEQPITKGSVFLIRSNHNAIAEGNLKLLIAYVAK